MDLILDDMLHTVGFLMSKISPRKLLVLSLVLLPEIMAALRTLSGKDSMDAVKRTVGFGITTGGKILLGEKETTFDW